ncbi:hypothetical protein pEaSNUABM37_00183 [Erwinia phage pEa_SNUABM_37]|nr:hypothetical protein pEaSNUABM37_00183 [Erwinia phage pEa_SNUABM_37]QXO10653.1 hypothetical protein pEaSNUABM48_00183 [Erwinia phage pEa_SNUABM_48]
MTVELRGGVDLNDGKYDHEKSPDYRRYATSTIKSAVKCLSALLDDNYYVEDIIAGWRHGFAPDAVARYLVGKSTSIDRDLFLNEYQIHAAHVLRTMLTVGYDGWGHSYGYTPSLKELQTPAPVVQASINTRLAMIKKLIDSNQPGLLYAEPKRLFNEPIENAGIIKNDCEVPVVLDFTDRVHAEVRKFISPVFVEAQLVGDKVSD